MEGNQGISFTEQGMKSFLERHSFSALLSFYAFYLAYSKKKPFTFESLEKKIDFLPKSYAFACFVNLVALGLLERTINKSTSEEIYNVTYYNPLLETSIKPILIKVAGRFDNQNRNNDNFENISWSKKIDFVDEYFQ